jgi:glutaredoxin 3
MAKEMFAANNIPFTDHNVGADLEKRKEMVDKTGQMGVPVITVALPGEEEKIIIGFDEEYLRELLGIKN